MVRKRWLLTVFGVARAKRDSLHAALRRHFGVIQSETAGKVGKLEEHLFVVTIPEEICLDQQRNLHVARHRATIDLPILRVIDVVDFDLVFSKAVTIDRDLNGHRVLADALTIGGISNAVLRQTLRLDRVLVEELGWHRAG